jgi:serine/threonine-protein kinase PpkA
MQIPGYRVIRKINQGGMSTVYLAIQISVGRVVALKVMSPTLNGDPAYSERFQREANIVGQLSHPNIVAIYDIGRHENLNYIAMDYLPGGSVHDRMMKGVTPADALRTTREIAIALDHAHEKGYIHRDIKPENILFRADQSAVLTDFGVAKGIGGVSRMTSVGQVVGTPHYMSPEQTRGKTVDSRSDLYSLGVVFYEMLTGTVPFQGDEAVAIAIKHISAPVPRLPRQYEAYQKTLDKMLAKDPDQRFQHGREIVEALETIENNQKAVNGKAADPNDLATLDLFKALLTATGNALQWRLRRALQLRWTPERGLYRQPAPHMTEVLFADDERNTLIAARLQHATQVQALLNPKQNKIRVALGATAALLIIVSGIWFFIPEKDSPKNASSGAVSSAASSLAINTTTPPANAVAGDVAGADVATGPASDSATTLTGDGSERTLEGTLEATFEGAPEGTLEVIADNNAAHASDSDLNEADFDERATLEPYPPLDELTSNTESITEPITEPEILKYSLTVTTTPEDALVRILNIGPRYTDGIQLTPGRYHIEVSHPGYITHATWITLTDMPLLTGITLQKAPVMPRNFSSDLSNGSQGPAMTTIGPGSFTMGDAQHSSSMPRHTVGIKKPFAISQYEITFQEYEQFAKATERALPGDNRWGRETRPVINVSWEDARAYTLWLSKMTGQTYRLPSESEWEYAARAGSIGLYWWGESNAAGRANCRRGCNSRFSGLFGSKTAPAGSYPANSFDIYDTAGNVAEWVQDCYAENYSAKPKNGDAFEVAGCPTRVVRGGSAKDNLDQIATPIRNHHPPGIYEEHLGFRVVMELN